MKVRIAVAIVAMLVSLPVALAANDTTKDTGQSKAGTSTVRNPPLQGQATTAKDKSSIKVATSESTEKKATEATNPAESPKWKVKEARRYVPPSSVEPTDAAGLGDVIIVSIDDLKGFLESVKEKRIHIFLSGLEVKGIPIESIDAEKNELKFRLLRREELADYANTPEQRAVWASIFGFRGRWDQQRYVEVSVGEEGGKPLPSADKSKVTMRLIRLRTGWGVIYLALLIVMILLYKGAAAKGAFRDRGPLEKEGDIPALSLARVQMGFWFFLVVAAFFFIWMVVGELPTIPASILVLIGIASGTALGAATVDANKREKANAIITELRLKQEESKQLQNIIDNKNGNIEKIRSNFLGKSRNMALDAQQTSANIDIAEREIAEIKNEIEELISKKSKLEARLVVFDEKVMNASKNRYAVTKQVSWIDELLSDDNGLSFHRLQMLIWTIVMGIVFIVKVAVNLSLPDFDAILLSLMGISSGTYLGFKFPEQQPATPPPTPAQTTQKTQSP